MHTVIFWGSATREITSGINHAAYLQSFGLMTGITKWLGS